MLSDQNVKPELKLLTEYLPVLGNVPLGTIFFECLIFVLVFFMPEWLPEDINAIKQNGGETSTIVECFTNQICRKQFFNEKQYHPG